MKKIGLLIVSTIVLSGCTPTNGILSKKDLMDSSIQGNYKAVESILEQQKDVAYAPDDIKDFVSKTKTDDQSDSGGGYLNIRLQDMDHMNLGSFVYDVYYGGRIETNSKAEFAKLVDILDETISSGIKGYLDAHMEEDIEANGIYTKIGKVWIYVTPIDKRDYPDHPDSTYEDAGLDEDLKGETTKNEVRLLIEVKDVKDKNYKNIVDSLIGEDLIVDYINVGKEQNLIQLSNVKSKFYEEYRSTLEIPALKYQLFMKDKEVNKARIFITSNANKEINDELESLTRLSQALKFNSEDMKQLDEIKDTIKKNKNGKRSLSSEDFNFSYKNLEAERSPYGKPEKINIAEIVIEKRK